MVIKYACEKCQSVLKVNDELAGSKGKCPKCKTVFVVPEAASRQPSPAQKPSSQKPKAEDELNDMVDMPIELTPEVDFSSCDEMDPLDAVQASDMAATSRRPEPLAADTPAAPKPSVAELMREHEAAKQKKDLKKNKGSLAGAAAAANVMTAGSAADSLTRNYDKKRGEASNAPPPTRDEIRAAEQRQALKEFLGKSSIALVAVLGLSWFMINWSFSEPLPELESVSGVVTQNGRPLAGVFVQFAPLAEPGSTEIATPSTGLTDSGGNYVMMYDPKNEGVLPGTHEVTIYSVSGIPYGLPEEDRQKSVSSDADNTFNFNL